MRYLFDAGLPLLALRNAIRSNNHATIDYMWLYMLNMFRASNKYLYSKMCVHVTHTHQRLLPELKSIWDDKRTASLRGHTGRNVAWDFTLERMNLEVQTLLGNNIVPERIGEVIRVLNGIRHTKDRALDAFGISDGELSEANGIAQTDLLALKEHIRSALGFDGNDDASKLFRKTSTQPFRTGNGTPWDMVDAAESNESTQAFVERNLRDCVGSNMN